MISTDFKLPVTIDCSKISTFDYSSLKGIESLTKDLKKRNQTLSLINVDEVLEKKMALRKL